MNGVIISSTPNPNRILILLCDCWCLFYSLPPPPLFLYEDTHSQICFNSDHNLFIVLSV